MQYVGKNHEILILESIQNKPAEFAIKLIPSGLTFLWFRKKQTIVIDGMPKDLFPDQVLCLTEFHRIEAQHLEDVRVIRFNRAFYCIKDHDDEVSCKGLLFYSASEVPVIAIPASDADKFELLWKMFSIEMTTVDSLQFEMLQMMLKRFIILCTRIYKSQHRMDDGKGNETEVIRNFKFLVEVHFRKLHTVSAYAAMLHKSPKTISNLFANHGDKSPLAIIQERIMLEARRLLRYSDKSIKEIAYELGYDDMQSFGRAFRNNVGVNPSDFKLQRSAALQPTREK